MKLLRGLDPIAASQTNCVATIGNFDGVHRGHQALLRALCAKATQLHLPTFVILFEPQPSEYFLGSAAPARLTSLREKAEIFSQYGVDYLCCIKFNQRLASMPADEFANRFIVSTVRAQYVLVGEDFRFGQGRIGDVALLQRMASQQGCSVETFPDYFVDGKRVSSTAIRGALSSGALEYAAKLLGRTFRLCGRVVHGDGRGRTWGVPTANVYIRHAALPLRGVFCVKVKRPGSATYLYGVANIGYRPTLGETRPLLEVHLFDCKESIYGEMLQVYFIHKLRNEIKFPSFDALVKQIHADVAAAKQYFNELGLGIS